MHVDHALLSELTDGSAIDARMDALEATDTALEATDTATDTRLDTVERNIEPLEINLANHGLVDGGAIEPAIDAARAFAVAEGADRGTAFVVPGGAYTHSTATIVLGTREILRARVGGQFGPDYNGAVTITSTYDGQVILVNGYAGWGIEGIVLKGDRTKASQDLLTFGENVAMGTGHVRDVSVSNAGRDGIVLNFVLNTHFDNVRSDRAKRHCWHFKDTQSNANTFTKCLAREAEQWGVYYRGGVGNTFTTPTIESNGKENNPLPVTAAAATDLFTSTAHGYTAGDMLRFSGLTGGAGIKQALSQAVTGVAATNLFTSAAHGLIAGDVVKFTGITGGAGLSASKAYFVLASGLTANDFKVSTTPTGLELDFTTDLTVGTLTKPNPTYFVIASGLTANDFKVSATQGGPTIDVTSDLTAGTVTRVYGGIRVTAEYHCMFTLIDAHFESNGGVGQIGGVPLLADPRISTNLIVIDAIEDSYSETNGMILNGGRFTSVGCTTQIDPHAVIGSGHEGATWVNPRRWGGGASTPGSGAFVIVDNSGASVVIGNGNPSARAGVLLGGDVEIYRSTNDQFRIADGDRLKQEGAVSGVVWDVRRSAEAQARLLVNTDGVHQWGGGAAGVDVTLDRGAADQLRLATDDALLIGAATGAGGSFIQFFEQSADPAVPAANGARLFSKDNGAGKTQLVVRFPTGATQVIATEP